MRQVKEATALRIIRNEKLLCVNCLSSEAGPENRVVYCNLKDELYAKDHFCPEGVWIVNGEVVDFRTGFQRVYDKDKSVGASKEITL